MFNLNDSSWFFAFVLVFIFFIFLFFRGDKESLHGRVVEDFMSINNSLSFLTHVEDFFINEVVTAVENNSLEFNSSIINESAVHNKSVVRGGGGGGSGPPAVVMPEEVNEPEWIESYGWTITSYGDVNEALYNGEKIEIFNEDNEPLGSYKEDFLEQVMIEGVGIGEGVDNNKSKFLHYNFEINDGKTFYFSEFPLGAYNNEIIPWDKENSSVAVNPVLPEGTRIRFLDLGENASLHEQGVQDLLLNKTFYADDSFFLEEGDMSKKIDVYVGLLERADYEGNQSLYIENVTLLIEKGDYNLSF